MRPSSLPFALLLLAAAAPGAAGDTFVLRDGAPLEAEVLRTFRDASGKVDRWEVRTLKGRRTLLSGEVREVRPRPADAPPYPWVAFETRLAFEDPGNVELLFALGEEAREAGMEAEARRAWRKAVAADPAGETPFGARARTALGHLKVDGRWVVPPGVERAPEERGEPLAGGPATATEGLLSRVLARRRSENYLLEADGLDQPALGRYLDTLETVREAFLSYLAEPPPGMARRQEYLLLADRESYLAVVEARVAPGLEERRDPEEARRMLRLFRAGHLAPLPDGSGCVALRASGEETEDRAFLAHFAVHEAWRSPHAAAGRDPDWLREAVAYSVLHPLFPDDPCWCVTADYGRPDRVPDAWRNTRTWPARARTLAAENKALAFQDLAVLDLNSLSFDALIQSWSVLRILRAKDENGTRAFLRTVRRGGDQFRALEECLRMKPADVDRLWRSEVLKGR